MTAREELAARMALHAHWLDEQFPLWAQERDDRHTIVGDIKRAAALLAESASEPTDEAVARELVFLWGCVVGTTEPSTAARRENESALVWVRAVNAARERARGKR